MAQSKNPRICLRLFSCHSRRESAFALALALAVAVQSPLHLHLPLQCSCLFPCLGLCLQVPQGFSLGSLNPQRKRGFSPWSMPSFPHTQTLVISTEAAHSLIVSSAAERSPHFAFAFLVVIPEGNLRLFFVVAVAPSFGCHSAAQRRNLLFRRPSHAANVRTNPLLISLVYAPVVGR
jgi:hypothetical protein